MTRERSNLELLTANEVAALLKIDRRTLFRKRAAGAIPPPVRIGGRVVRWPAGVLLRWIEQGCPSL